MSGIVNMTLYVNEILLKNQQWNSQNWYSSNGFVHKGTRKFDHLTFTVGVMEWNCVALN